MHELNILLKIEFRRAFKNKLFAASIVIGLALAAGAFIQTVVPHIDVLGGYDGSVASYPHSVFTSWMAKFITTFVVGGLIVVIPLLVNLIATMMFVPALKPIENGLFMGNGSSFMNVLFVKHTFIYTFIYIVQFFIYGGAFCVIALASSYIFNNSFLVMLMPFVTFYGLGVVSNMLRNMFGMDSFNPMRLLASNMLSDKQLAAYILEPIIITVISGIIFFVKGADNEAL